MNKKQREFLSRFFDEYQDTTSAVGCSEPGYDDKPVILANWNNIPDETYHKLEETGFSCEWEDEWLICDNCNKAFRSSPDSYGWEMYGIIQDGAAICGDCIDIAEYLESIENQPRQALTCALKHKYDPSEYGYRLVQDEFENGFHPGQTDDPRKILAGLLEKNPTGRYIFTIDGQGQFEITFSVYEKIPQDEPEE